MLVGAVGANESGGGPDDWVAVHLGAAVPLVRFNLRGRPAATKVEEKSSTQSESPEK